MQLEVIGLAIRWFPILSQNVVITKYDDETILWT